MAENGFFETVFRGFRKEEVLNYIDSLNTTHCEETAHLQQQLEDWQQKHAQVSEQLPALEQQLAALQQENKALKDAQKQLEALRQQYVVVEEENRRQKEQLAAAEETAAQYKRLQTETEVQKQQLADQQQQLDAFEKLFGDSRSVTALIQGTVGTRLRQAQQRTEDTLQAAERLADKLDTELQALREQTDSIRKAAAAAGKAEERELSDWLSQFRSDTTPPHFFR